MKKRSKTIVVLLLVVLCGCLLAACNKVDTSPDFTPKTTRNTGVYEGFEAR